MVRLRADDFYGVPFFLAAVMLISWYGGFLPGLLATGLSLLAIGLLYTFTAGESGLDSAGAWHLVTFSVVALAVHGFSLWRAQVESSLRAAKSDLLEANAAADRYLQAERTARKGVELSHYRISRLQAVTASLSRSVTPAEVAEVVVDEGVAALGAWAGSIVLFDRAKAEAVTIAYTGYDSMTVRRSLRMPLSAHLPITEAIRSGQPVFLSSPGELAERYPEVEPDPRSRAWAAIPLLQNDLVIGAMGLSFEAEHEFDPADREMMSVLASQCAQAIERARLYQAEHQARQAAERISYRTSRLQAVTAALSGATTPAEVAKVVVEEGTAALGANSGLLFFMTDDGQSMRIAGGTGYSPELVERYSNVLITSSAVLARPLISRSGAFYDERDQVVASHPGLENLLVETGTEALAILPVRAHGELLGLLTMSFQQPRRFSEDERELMMAFANQAAQALERARLFEKEERARIAAEEAEQRYRALAESIPALVILADPRGRAFYHNRRFLDYVGATGVELRGGEWWRIMHPSDRRAVFRSWRSSMHGGAQSEMEFRMRAKDGSYRWHSGRTIPITDPDGTVRMWVGFAVDIEERKRAEQALIESEARYRTLAESMPALVSLVDDEGRAVYVNQRWLDYVGATPEDVIGLAWQRYFHPQDLASLLSKWEVMRHSGQVIEHELRARRHDGQYRWLRAHVMPMPRFSGSGRWVAVATDIQDIRQAEERERFLSAASAVLASTLDPRAILDEVGRLIVPQVADCFGIYGSEEGDAVLYSSACGPSVQAFEAFFPDRLPLRASHPVSVALATGEVQHHPDGYVTPDGARADSLLVLPFVSHGDHLGALAVAQIGSGRTVTEADRSMLQELARRLSLAVENARLFEASQEAQARMKAALEAKDEFLGLMSHELRTPTTTIYGGIRVLRQREHALQPADREALLADMETESDRLFRMIEDLLVLGRLEEGTRLPSEPVRIEHEVRRAVTAYSHRRPKRTIRVRTDKALRMVASDPTYLEQVMHNLLNNADKYSPADGTVYVDVRAGERGVVISVMDEGPGVSAEDLNAIFDKFYRAESTSKQARGIGLGLTVCKRLVEAQSGRIWAEPREGGGLAIKFELPYYAEVLE
jgi:PAS domain S-box-containing protein